MRRFFPYFGSKWSHAKRYPAPVHDLVIEPFAGAAGYSTALGVKKALLVDRCPVVAGLWRYLIEASREDILALPMLEPGQLVEDLDLPAPARALIGFWINPGNSRPAKTPGPWARSQEHPGSTWSPRVRWRISDQVDQIRDWEIREGSYEDIRNQKATWFVDPPYQVKGEHYRFGPSRLDYGHLADWCRERRGRTVVCEGPGAEWLPFWHLFDGISHKHTVGHRTSSELVWTNADGFMRQHSLFEE